MRVLAIFLTLCVLNACGRGVAFNPTVEAPQSAAGSALSIQVYRAVDLGANLYPTAINSRNWIVGGVSGGDAFLYRNGSLKLLGPLRGDAQAEAFGINDTGTIIGTSYGGPPAYHERAVIFDESGRIKALGTGSGTDSSGIAVNRSGTLIGSTFTDGNYCFGDAVIFNGHGGIEKHIGRAGFSQARALNDAGTILYDVLYTDGGPCEGLIDMRIYPGNKVVQLPPNNDNDNTNDVTGINDYGHIIGYFRDANDSSAGFFDHDGISQEIRYGKDSATFPSDIDPGDRIVGTVELPRTIQAFIWQRGRFTMLKDVVANARGWQFESAARINRNGYIIGVGARFGDEHGFLLIPKT